MSKLPDKCTSNFQTHNSELPEIKKPINHLHEFYPPGSCAWPFPLNYWDPDSGHLAPPTTSCTVLWSGRFSSDSSAMLVSSRNHLKIPAYQRYEHGDQGKLCESKPTGFFFLSLSQIHVNLMLCSIFLAYKKCILLFENFWLYKYLHIIASNMLCIENSLSEHKLTGIFFFYLFDK